MSEARGRAFLVLCYGGPNHVMDGLRVVPVDIATRWHLSLLRRMPGGGDVLPRLYACGTCFGADTTDADYMEALGTQPLGRPA